MNAVMLLDQCCCARTFRSGTVLNPASSSITDPVEAYTVYCRRHECRSSSERFACWIALRSTHYRKKFRIESRNWKRRRCSLTSLSKRLEREGRCFGKPSDVLRLNVGGTCIDVLRRTLTSVEGSMLATRFSGRWDDSLEKDADGNFFIDQPIELFLPLVNLFTCSRMRDSPRALMPRRLEWTNYSKLTLLEWLNTMA